MMPPATPNLSPTIYMAIEESMRELESRLLVAGFAVEQGITVVIGQQLMLTENLPHLQPGIVLFKGNNTVQHGFMKAAQRAGHLVASIEEEALGVARADQIERLYDRGVEQTCQIFLAQGEFHRTLLAAMMPDASDRIAIVGNPRMDFLRPVFLKTIEPERDEIRRAHGRFILVNTNVASVNSGLGDALAYYDMCIKTRYIMPGDPAGERELRDQLAWERANTREATRLMRWIVDNIPEVSVIVRPHPSERIETWQNALRDRPRIRVIREGSHLPWTLASEILVHTSCTTGMEAFAAGHRAISLCPGSSQWHDCMVSNLVNPTFESYLDAATYLRAQISQRHGAERERARFESELNRHVAAASGAMSAERVVAALAGRLPVDRPRRAAAIKPRPGFRATRPGSHVRPTEQLAEVEARFARIKRTLGRFAGQHVTELGQSLYQIGSGET